MIKVIHKKCGKIAFYFKKKLNHGDLIRATNIRTIDRETPLPNTAIICGSCGDWINRPGSDTLVQEHWTDWFVIDD